jgi:hypothetical protein
LVIPADVEVDTGVLEAVGVVELAFVVLFVGVDVVPTAATDGVLVVVPRVGVVVVVGVVGRVDALVVVRGAGGGVVVGSAMGVEVVVVADEAMAEVGALVPKIVSGGPPLALVAVQIAALVAASARAVASATRALDALGISARRAKRMRIAFRLEG